MPRLNAVGNIIAGVGGGVVSLDRRVIATNAGQSCWLDDRAIYQVGAQLWTCTPDGSPTLIDNQGANNLAAGGGVYQAVFDGVLRVVAGGARSPYPHHYVGDVALDGSALVLTPDGLLAGQEVRELQALGGDTWSGLDVNYRPIQSAGVPPLAVVEGRIYGLRRAGPYCCYLAEEGARFIVQHQNRPEGKVVAVTNAAFRPDLRVLSNGDIAVCYSLTAGEVPGDLRDWRLSPSELTEDLRRPVVVVTPLPIPQPPLVPTPEEKVPKGLTDQQFETLVRERAKFPAWNEDLQGPRMTPAQTGDMLNRVCWAHRDEGLGMQSKPGGTAAIHPDGQSIWNGLRGRDTDGTQWGQDVLVGASIGKNEPGRQTPGAIKDGDPPFVKPIKPADVPDPDPDAKLPSVTTEFQALVLARLEKIEADLARLRADANTGTADDLARTRLSELDSALEALTGVVDQCVRKGAEVSLTGEVTLLGQKIPVKVNGKL